MAVILRRAEMSKLFCIRVKVHPASTIFKRLVKDRELDLKTVVSYTTRPMREGEREGVEYHFVSPQMLRDFREEGRVIECRDYHTVHGLWSYFMVDDGQIDFFGAQDSVIIGTLESYQKIRDFFGKRTCRTDLCLCGRRTSVVEGLEREKQQENPGYAEMCRRFLADTEDFSEEKLRACEICRFMRILIWTAVWKKFVRIF